MDQINHAYYILSLYFPAGFNYGKAEPQERLKVLESIDVNSAKSREVTDFFKQHRTVIDPTLALSEMLSHPSDQAYSEIEPGAARPV